MIDEDALVLRYRELRDKKKQIESDAKLAMVPYVQAMEKIEAYFMGRLAETKQKNFAFANGTVFTTEIMRCSVSDRATLETWVQEQGGTPAVFTNSLSKDYIAQYLEQEDQPPPGVKVEYIMNLNVRKP